jgi:hypothetical protein
MVPWLVVVLDVCVRMSLHRLECKSANLVMLGGVSFPFFRVWGQVLSPPIKLSLQKILLEIKTNKYLLQRKIRFQKYWLVVNIKVF